LQIHTVDIGVHTQQTLGGGEELVELHAVTWVCRRQPGRRRGDSDRKVIRADRVLTVM
jgi:hypothetical protein